MINCSHIQTHRHRTLRTRSVRSSAVDGMDWMVCLESNRGGRRRRRRCHGNVALQLSARCNGRRRLAKVANIWHIFPPFLRVSPFLIAPYGVRASSLPVFPRVNMLEHVFLFYRSLFVSDYDDFRRMEEIGAFEVFFFVGKCVKLCARLSFVHSRINGNRNLTLWKIVKNCLYPSKPKAKP